MNFILTAVNAKYIHSNLAVLSLKTYAEAYEKPCEEDSSGHVTIAEYTINQKTEEILADLYKKKPDVLCFSCYIWNLCCVEELVHEIAKLMPELPVWLGGPEVTYDSGAVLKRLPEVTGIMRGEGEQTFLELRNMYCGSGRTLEAICGITYRTKDGIIQENSEREPIDMNQLPFVYSNLEEMEHKIIYYETSRGCPFSCSYCLSSIDKSLRFRKLEYVKKELQFFLDAKIGQVKFVDRTFNCNHGHTMAIWRYLLENDNGITNFHFEISADLLTEEELNLMAEMRPGLIQLEVGVQSVCEATLKEIRRTTDMKRLAKNVCQIKKAGNIHQHLDLIAGLPFENYTCFRKSFNEVYLLEPENLQLGFLKILKGSYMEEQKNAYGLIHRSAPPYEVLCTKWISYTELLQLKRIEEVLEIYYNSGQFAETIKFLLNAFADPFELYEKLGSYYMEQGLCAVSHSRIARYEILYAFAQKNDRRNWQRYRELLTYDLYLRENMKNRPAFSGEPTVDKEEQRVFYEHEKEEGRYLYGYEGYDVRQLRKMTHLERFADGRYLLFDYKNRDPFTRNAAVFTVLPAAFRRGTGG